MRKDSELWWRMQLEENVSQHPAQHAHLQVDGVERYISLEARARVLDLSCGLGRQTLELARRGYRVLGLDPREGPLVEARRLAREERLNVHFLAGDMGQLHYRGEFDAVVNLFAAIGYLPNDRDHARVLEGVRKGLKSGGKLLLDQINKEWLMRHFEPNSWGQGEATHGAVALDRVLFNFETGRLDNHRTVVGADGERVPAFMSVRLYTLTEMKGLLERAGLEFDHVWGGYEGQPYGMDSPRMVVLAHRPAEAAARKPQPEDLVRAIRIKGRSRRR